MHCLKIVFATVNFCPCFLQVNLGLASMNKGDCFILDAGTEIYVFVGAKAKRTERLKAISAANQIRDQDHAGRSKVVIVGRCSFVYPTGEPEHVLSVEGSNDPALLKHL